MPLTEISPTCASASSGVSAWSPSGHAADGDLGVIWVGFFADGALEDKMWATSTLENTMLEVPITLAHARGHDSVAFARVAELWALPTSGWGAIGAAVQISASFGEFLLH